MVVVWSINIVQDKCLLSSVILSTIIPIISGLEATLNSYTQFQVSYSHEKPTIEQMLEEHFGLIE